MTKSRRASRKGKTRRGGYTRKGGACPLQGSPLSENLSQSWSSRMSLGQGADYFNYHKGQHGGRRSRRRSRGGSCNLAGAPLTAISDSSLSSNLRSSAMLDGLDGAFRYIDGMSDMNGGKRGKRRKHKHGKKCHHTRNKRRRNKRTRNKRTRNKRSRGGSCHGLGFSPFPSQGMLLSPGDYTKAGLNPEWRTNAEFDAANVRSNQ